MVDICIIDYKMGNLYSITRGLEKAGANVEIIEKPIKEFNFDGLVIPGVGAFKTAIKNIIPFKPAIADFYDNGKPILGICLGLQLFFSKSYEGGVYDGLDFIKGDVIRFPDDLDEPVPHMGWNTIEILNDESPILKDISSDTYFYFVHSYYGKPQNNDYIIATTNYGLDFPSIVSRKNLFLVQFHPEKSSSEGLKILKNFIALSNRS